MDKEKTGSSQVNLRQEQGPEVLMELYVTDLSVLKVTYLSLPVTVLGFDFSVRISAGVGSQKTS